MPSILVPNSGWPSFWSGHAATGNDGNTLGSPLTGVGSVAYYVKDGPSAPNDTTHWRNGNVPGPGPQLAWFSVNITEFFGIPVFASGISLRSRGSGVVVTLTDTELWFKKVYNPILGNDIQITSNTLSHSIGGTSNYTNSGFSQLTIIEENRACFESGIVTGIVTLSGLLTFSSVGLGADVSRITEHELEVIFSGSPPVGPSGASGSLDLYIYGHSTQSGSLDLYIGSSTPSSGLLDLYIDGVDGNNSGVDLFINGYANSSGSLDLFILGGTAASGSLDLYIAGPIESSGSLDLYIGGISSNSGTMNLFCEAKGTISSGTLSLYINSFGSTSGVFNSTDLVLWNNQQFDNAYVMNLYSQGPSYYNSSGSMNLYLESSNSGAWSLDLFIQNSYASISGYQPLFIQAPSGTLGVVPISGTMNLIIWRDMADWLPLYLSTIEGISGNFPLFIDGITSSTGIIPMYISGRHEPNNTMMLYTHGF